MRSCIPSVETLLRELVASGRLSLSEADIKQANKPGVKRLLYDLGAYKNTPIASNLQRNFGLRICKKCVDDGIPLNNESIAESVFKVELDNYSKILGYRPVFKNTEKLYLKEEFKKLKLWRGLQRGRDLFVKGLGRFDIMKAYNRSMEMKTPRNARVFIPAPGNITIFGYFPEIDNIQMLLRVYNSNIELFKWIYVHDFPMERIDELIDLDILGMFNPKLSVSAVITRLDDLVDRNLNLEYIDSHEFKYKNKIKRFSEISGLVLPKNGIELKSQARKFKNCAGNYTKWILSGKTVIMYNDREMLEVDPDGTRIIQHTGTANLRPPLDLQELRINQLAVVN